MLTGVGTLLWGALIGVGVIVATWAVMIVLARRLPPGVAKDLATVLPACATTARRPAARSACSATSACVAVVIALLWVLSPIDLIPEFLPVIGPLAARMKTYLSGRGQRDPLHR